MSNLTVDDRNFIQTAHDSIQAKLQVAWLALADMRNTLSLDSVDSDNISTAAAAKAAGIRVRQAVNATLIYIDGISGDFPE